MSALGLFAYWLATIVVTLIMMYPIFKLVLIVTHKFKYGECTSDEMQGCHYITYEPNKEMLDCEFCGQGFLNFGGGS